MATTTVPPPGHVHPATSDEGLDAQIALDYLNSQLKANYEGSEARYKRYKTHKHLTEELSACAGRIYCDPYTSDDCL